MRPRRSGREVGSRQGQPLPVEAGVAQGCRACQRRIEGEGYAMDHGPVAHLVAAGIAEVGFEGPRLGAGVIRKARAARASVALTCPSAVYMRSPRILAEWTFGRPAVLVDDLPTLEPPGPDQAVARSDSSTLLSHLTGEFNRSRSPPIVKPPTRLADHDANFGAPVPLQLVRVGGRSTRTVCRHGGPVSPYLSLFSSASFPDSKIDRAACWVRKSFLHRSVYTKKFSTCCALQHRKIVHRLV